MESAAITLGIPRRESVLSQVPWRWWHVVVGMMPLLILRGLDLMISAGWLPGLPISFSLPITVLQALWMLFWPLYIARRFGRVPHWPDTKGMVFEASVAVLAWLALFFVLSVVVIIAHRLLGRFAPPLNPFERLSGRVTHFELISLALSAVALAPLAEETFFRGMFHNALRRRLPLLVAAVIQGLVFGFLHTFNLTHSILASLLGIAFALVYEWRRTLVAPILLHAIQNGVMVLSTAALLAASADKASLGIRVQTHEDGCRVAAVVPGGAADEAGVRVGDVLTKIDGSRVVDETSVADTLMSRHPGEVVAIDFRRDGEQHRVEATLKRKGW
jgi:membrane protease YdiL (CAAX protease family)